MQLVRVGQSPFSGAWDVKLPIEEIEMALNTTLVDMPFVDEGSNNYVQLLFLQCLSRA